MNPTFQANLAYGTPSQYAPTLIQVYSPMPNQTMNSMEAAKQPPPTGGDPDKLVNVSQAQTDTEKKAEEKKNQRKALLPFAIISLSYLLYTMTDGSVRMIVLLHAYNKKFTAMEVAGEKILDADGDPQC